MGTYYFDSSAMVKHYIPERGSEWVSSLIEAKMDGKPQNLIAIAEIGEVEVAAALAKRRRMNEISAAQQRIGLVTFLRHCARRYHVLQMDSTIIKLAIELTQRHPLRGYDAVHLAIALIFNRALVEDSLLPLTFISADDVLCTASRKEGLPTENPNDY
ncbi:MAG: type II toxin-antitoxin system VapC family toxin [Anaerolineae bacterium]